MSERRPTTFTPLFDALCIEFARRELTDDALAARLEEWS